jgi:hypothetical protein
VAVFVDAKTIHHHDVRPIHGLSSHDQPAQALPVRNFEDLMREAIWNQRMDRSIFGG